MFINRSWATTADEQHCYNTGRVTGGQVDRSWVDRLMGHRLTGVQVTGHNGQWVMGNSIVDDSRLCNVLMTLTMCHCQTPDNRCGFWSPNPQVNLCYSLPSVSEPALCSPFNSEPTFLIKKLGPSFAHLWSVTCDPNWTQFVAMPEVTTLIYLTTHTSPASIIAQRANTVTSGHNM